MARAATDYGYRITTSRFDAFSRDMLAHLTAEQQEEMLKGVALKLLERLVMHGTGTGTPVDTGRARAGWAAGLDGCGGSYHPFGSDWVEEDKGKKEGAFESGTKREGLIGESYDSPFVRIYNGVPYIVYLEMGSSDQAPAGMVRINMEILRLDLRAAELEAVKSAIAEGNVAARAAGLKWVGA